MSIFSIILLSLLALYLAVWCLDRFLFTPKREYRTLPVIDARLKEVEKRLEELTNKETDI